MQALLGEAPGGALGDADADHFASGVGLALPEVDFFLELAGALHGDHFEQLPAFELVAGQVEVVVEDVAPACSLALPFAQGVSRVHDRRPRAPLADRSALTRAGLRLAIGAAV